jgi:hypothetical protein
MTDIQALHAPAVLAGDLKLCTKWGAPGVGYLLLFRPDAGASAALAEVQDQVLALEPALLRQPETRLHTSVAWLLPVAREFSEPKDALWAEHGEDWLKIIESVTESIQPIRLRYRRLVQQPLSDPAGLLHRLEAMPVAIETGVSELLVIRESVYYTLEYEVLRRLPLGKAQ